MLIPSFIYITYKKPNKILNISIQLSLVITNMVHIIWFSTLDYTIDNSEHFVGYIVHNQEIGVYLQAFSVLHINYTLIVHHCGFCS